MKDKEDSTSQVEMIRDMISKHKMESWNRKMILVEKLVIC